MRSAVMIRPLREKWIFSNDTNVASAGQGCRHRPGATPRVANSKGQLICGGQGLGGAQSGRQSGRIYWVGDWPKRAAPVDRTLDETMTHHGAAVPVDSCGQAILDRSPALLLLLIGACWAAGTNQQVALRTNMRCRGWLALIAESLCGSRGRGISIILRV